MQTACWVVTPFAGMGLQFAQEALIANRDEEMSATVTTNHNLVLITRQFIWMELFAQRIYSRLDKDLITKLNPEDQKLFNGFTPVRGKRVD